MLTSLLLAVTKKMIILFVLCVVMIYADPIGEYTFENLFWNIEKHVMVTRESRVF